MAFKNDSLELKTQTGFLISSCFEQLQKKDRIALMPFLMAGDPSLKITAELLLRLQDCGVDMIELGVPYSDPLADGPVIQEAASRALKSGTTINGILEMLTALKGKLSIPIILFTYSNPLLNRGMDTFCATAADAGVSGLVVPDLPLEEAERLSVLALEKRIELVLLVAPTTPKERMTRISSRSKGFTYLVSVTGVTGERSVMEDRVGHLVKELKQLSSKPVAVGFGISGPKQVRQVREWGADGAIVGSALVKRIANSSPGREVDEAILFCRELLEEVN